MQCKANRNQRSVKSTQISGIRIILLLYLIKVYYSVRLSYYFPIVLAQQIQISNSVYLCCIAANSSLQDLWIKHAIKLLHCKFNFQNYYDVSCYNSNMLRNFKVLHNELKYNAKWNRYVYIHIYRLNGRKRMKLAKMKNLSQLVWGMVCPQEKSEENFVNKLRRIFF